MWEIAEDIEEEFGIFRPSANLRKDHLSNVNYHIGRRQVT